MNFTKLQTTFAAAAEKSGLLGTLFWWDLGQNRIEHNKLVEHAQRRWRKLDGSQLLLEVLAGKRFIDGIIDTDQCDAA